MDAKSKRCQFFKRFCRLEVPLRRERPTSLFITKRMSPWNQRTSRRNHPTPYLYWMPKQLSLDSWSYWRWIQLQIIIHPFISEDKMKWQIIVFKQFFYQLLRFEKLDIKTKQIENCLAIISIYIYISFSILQGLHQMN